MGTIEAAYTYVIVGLVLFCMGCWLYCTIINRRQGTSFYSVGNIIITLSFLPLLLRNMMTYWGMFNNIPHWLSCHFTTKGLTEFYMQLTLSTMMLQAIGVGYFIMAYHYNKKKKKLYL